MLKLKDKDRVFTTVTTKKDTSGIITLRTIPVFLRNGTKRVKVNVLLDYASTKTYRCYCRIRSLAMSTTSQC